MPLEERSARLTILIDPRKKAVFDYLCSRDDVTPSQVVRRMIREFIEHRLGHPWVPGESVRATLERARIEASQRANSAKP